MHPFERLMADVLERDEQLSLGLFGNLKTLLEAITDIGKSPLMPEFLRLVLTATPEEKQNEQETLNEFICRCIESASNDIAVREAIDLLDEAQPLPTEVNQRCFTRFLSLASERTASPMARSAALDGAFRWALPDRRHQLRLLDLLLGIQSDDTPIFLTRAAKIIGVAYSHWRESSLLERLRQLCDVDEVTDEASFELGMARLADGLDLSDRQRAEEAFTAAKSWFVHSLENRETRPDAAAYICCLDVLLAFSRGEECPRLEELADSLSATVFEMQAWHNRSDAPSWLGARHTECTYWNTLALSLKELALHLVEASWWEPATVVEDFVIACYTASRSILKRSQNGGIETLIRPRIERSLATAEGLAHHLKVWLRRNTGHEWEAEARGLSERIDALVDKSPPHPSEAATVLPTVVAMIEEAGIPEDKKVAAISTIINASAVHLSNLSESVIAILEECLKKISDSPDYRDNANGRRLFDAVLSWTIVFLNTRLDNTGGHGPDISYLFERKDGTLPHENELQNDYYQFMATNVAGTEFEANNVGGGRADVRFVYRGERLVTEVKREDGDCSFEALKQYYSAQITEYQNVSIRLGFLLVHDLSERRVGGTPHILTLVRAFSVHRKGETEPRWVVIVKVPGRRLRPSDLTKLAKKRLSPD